ncbi:calpain-5-like isoform X1 [Gordionus sp. m RMFG-2023]|uniref:calpain-5-like isoform X1 n=1 Tax=Gordionus sp. m RMFG-2023 TaxID=3053472 RepID=UPI0031FE26A5
MEIVPDHKEQDWDLKKPEKYVGIFHFRFWRFGEWIDIVIDDRLPTINGELVFTRSRIKNEFWVSLLEKAYAKLNGCYEALDGGNLSDALVDFTGGICENVELKLNPPDGSLPNGTNVASTVETSGVYYCSEPEVRKKLFDTLLREVARRSLMCAAIDVKDESERETKTPTGLIKGHAYGITAVKKLYSKDAPLLDISRLLRTNEPRDKFYMIRLKNPWGGKNEWTGPFGDGSPEWEKITIVQREKLGLTFDDDGEFWMAFDDFCQNFTHLSICYVLNTAYMTLQKTWHESVLWSKWINGPVGSKTDRAGGCVNFDTFLQNPQCLLTLYESPLEKEEILFYLTQKDRREVKLYEKSQNLIIGFSLFKAEQNRIYRVHDIRFTEKAGQSDYVNSRSVFLRAFLPSPGTYLVLPTTFKPHEEGDFLFRVYSSYRCNFRMAKLDYPKRTIFSGCYGYPTCVYRLTIKHATAIEKQDKLGADPYVMVYCEKYSYRTRTVKDSLSPVWNESYIFYCKKRNSPIRIEVWNSNLMKDTFMGQIEVEPRIDDSVQNLEMSLLGKGKTSSSAKPGTLNIEIAASDNVKNYL